MKKKGSKRKHRIKMQRIERYRACEFPIERATRNSETRPPFPSRANQGGRRERGRGGWLSSNTEHDREGRGIRAGYTWGEGEVVDKGIKRREKVEIFWEGTTCWGGHRIRQIGPGSTIDKL